MRFILFYFLSICLMSCSCGREDSRALPSNEEYGFRTPIPQNACESTNPFTEGTGHYAGYEWADKKRPSSCEGNSNSFVEGCEEWLSQQECMDE